VRTPPRPDQSVQLPFTQNWNIVHALPQPPQLAASVSTSTQAPLHSFASDPHLHAPD
jgi:hypothetical protein